MTTQLKTRTGAPRRYNPTTLAGQLNAEWDRITTDPVATASVDSWALSQPALRGCRTLADIEAATCDPARQDDVLGALVRLSHDGDQLAERTLLQLMLGKAIRIAATYTGCDSQESLESVTITALWETIATYPIERRPTKIAANLALDTLHIVSNELASYRNEAATEPETLAAVLTHTPEATQETSDLELLNLLAWAVGNGSITTDDAQLIIDTYAPAPGCSGGHEAANKHQLTWAAARKRTSRATQKIIQALADDTSF